MRYIQFRGAEGQLIAASEVGPANGPNVLLAHGGGQTRASWVKTIKTLGRSGYRAVAVDLRGHGESAWSEEGNYALEDFADDLIAVASQLNEKPSLIGASLGGLAGLLVEGRICPLTFHSLTLVDVVPAMEAAGIAKVTGFMKAHITEGFSSPAEAAEIIASYLPNRAGRSTTEGLSRYLRYCVDGRYRWHWDPRFITSVMTSRTGSAGNHLVEAAKHLQLPVHLIRGNSSELVSRRAAADFLKLVPHARYTDIVGAGHMVVGDRNDAFTTAIEAFLASVYAGSHHD